MILKKSLMVASALGAVALVAVAQGCSSSGAKAGDEGGACLPSMMCNGMLSCVSNVCVNLASDGSTQDMKVADMKTQDMKVMDNNMGPMCPTPADVSGYMPPAYVPPNAVQMKCNSTAIQGYYDNCLGPMGTNMKCTAFRMANMDCAKCIESAKTDASWGPLIFGNGVASCNVAGCMDLKGDKGCAQSYEKLSGCQDLGCDMQCPVMDTQTFNDYLKCVNTVTAGGCKMYADSLATMCANDASAAYTACRNFQGFQDCYNQYAVTWCGGAG